MRLEGQIEQIIEVDLDSMENARIRWNSIAKPIRSLGGLESAIIQIAGITRNANRINIKKRALLIFCADHGVTKEGITQTGSQVTRIVTDNFAKGSSCVNRMAEVSHVDVYPIDIGMEGSIYKTKDLKIGEVTGRKISQGSNNIRTESAMTIEQCRKAIQVGIEAVKELKDKGYNIIATGEMGIGNTTPTSALAATWLKQPIEQVTGKGAGLTEEGYRRKLMVLKEIIHRHQVSNKTTVLETLADIGGYDIAGMTGAFIGASIYQIPIIMDGVISQVAALAAVLLAPKVEGYILASHESKEPSSRLLLNALNKESMIQCNMCLGEGSGAIAVLPLIDMGAAVYENMSTFKENQIESYVDHRRKE